MNYVTFAIKTHYEVIRFDIAVYYVLMVHPLDTPDHLNTKHAHCLKRKTLSVLLKQRFKGFTQ